MTRTLAYFLAGAFAGWLVLADAGYALQGVYGLICAGVVGPLCIVPTTVSLIMALWSSHRSGSEQLMAIIGGMGVRMAVVLGLSLLIFMSIPQFRVDKKHELTFWGFVLVGYLATLAWETVLAARNQNGAESSTSQVEG